MDVKVFCPAKINLSLQVTGKREDGYHLLHSLVVFAENIGDELTITKGDKTSLTVTGPFASVVPQDNSLLAAIAFAEQQHGKQLPTSMILEKNLPAGAGIGGGSADAAGVLRGLEQLYNLPPLAPASLTPLGADVPVCYVNKPAIMQGIGEVVTPVDFPPTNLLLINPGIPISTPAVFQAMGPGEWSGPLGEALNWQQHSNDLEAVAQQLYPNLDMAMQDVAALEGVNLIRLSGSGSTFFVLGDDLDGLEQQVKSRWPGWWVRRVVTNDTVSENVQT